MDELIDLIEEGDPTKILSEEDLFPKFNELVKYGLVVLKDEKVFLTKKGIQAKKEGVDLFLKKENFAKIQTQYLENEAYNRKNKEFFENLKRPKLIQWAFFIILFVLTFSTKLYHSKIKNTSKK